MPQDEDYNRRKANEALLMKSIQAQIDREEKNYPQKELDRAYTSLVKNAKTVRFSKDDVDFKLQSERKRRARLEKERAIKEREAAIKEADDRREAAIEANPLLEKRQIRNEGGDMTEGLKKQLKKYENIWSNESGKYTKKEQAEAGEAYNMIVQTMNQYVDEPMPILVGPFKKTKVGKPGYNRKTKRTLYETGGDVDNQMSMLMGEEPIDEPLENTMLPDEEMEEDYVEYVVDSILSPEDKEYLENALMEDAKLSEIFDQLIESATEFSGSGLIEGPGSERSDSIPARLSDGEFVLTAKATDEIGSDNLMSMMKDAEAAADERQGVAYGGYMTEREDETAPIQTSGLRNARRNIPQVAQTKRQVEEEMLKSSPRRFYQPISG